MQLSGLRSITAKHLALTCQSLDALLALAPHLTALFCLPVQQPRRALLAPEFDRVFQVKIPPAAIVTRHALGYCT